MRRRRIIEGRRLVYYGPRADNPDFWGHVWEASDIPGVMEQAELGNAPFGLMEKFEEYLPAGAPLIEAGCGIGQYAVALRARGYDIVGVDFSEKTIEAVKAVKPDANVTTGDILDLDYQDGHFGGYVSLGVVEHFPDGPEPALREAHRVLRPGGIIMCSVPHFNSLRRVSGRFRIPRKNDGDFYQYAFGAREFSEIIRSHGFRIVEVFGYNSLKGLKDEIPVFGRMLLSHRIPGRVHHRIQRSRYLGRHAGHMLMIVAERV